MSNNVKKAESQIIPTRRSFLNILWLILGGVALAEFIAVAFAFLRPRKSKTPGENTDLTIIAGAVEKICTEFGYRICAREILPGTTG